MDIKELFLEFLDSKLLIYVLEIYLFGLIFYVVYSVINYFKYNSHANEKIKSFYAQMSEAERERAEAERRDRDIHGEGGKKDFLASIDEKLAYSGIKEKIPWLTTEFYLLAVIVFDAIITLIIVVFKGAGFGIMAAILVPMIFELLLSGSIMIRSNKTEEQMLQFMNIIDNFSKSSDDLIDILERSSRYIENPLGDQIYTAVVNAKNSGNQTLALIELQNSVKNKHFKVLIRNLEICSRYDTNYDTIIEDCREVFHSYIRSEREKGTIRKNGVAQILIMIVLGGFCVVATSSMDDTSSNFIQAFTSGGTLGYLVLGFLAFALVAALYIMIFKVLRSK